MADLGDFLPPLAEWFPITTDYGDEGALGSGTHYALDIGALEGTPLYSIGPGTVLEPDGNPEGVTGGKTVTVDYGNGIVVTFAHLSEIFVRPGQQIGAAEMIGKTGSTGMVTGPHLHIDAWKNGTKINPLDLFDWAADKIDPSVYPSRPGISPFPTVGIGGAIGGVFEGINAVGAGVIAFVGAILNPENWARILAIFGGAILALIGGWMVWSST